MSRGVELVKNTGILALGTFLPKLAAFITLPILTGMLTKDEYGTYDLVTVMVSLLLPALTLQVKAAAFRFLIDVREDEKAQNAIISNIMVLTIPVSCVALVVLFLVLNRSIEGSICAIVCFYYFADIFSNTFRQIARGLGRNIDYAASAVLSATGKMIFAITLVWGLGWGLRGAIIGLAAASSVSVIYLAVRLRVFSHVSRKALDGALMKRMLAYSWPIVPSELAMWVVQMSNRLVIIAYMGLAANAAFAVATKIPQIISLAQSAFSLAWQENASIASKDEDAGAYYSAMLRVVYGLQAGFFGLVVAATPLLFSILVRGDYAEAYPQIPILCLGVFFSSMSTFMGGIYISQMRTTSVGITTSLAAVLNVMLNIVLIGPMGLYAASLASAASFLALFLFRLIDVNRFVNIKLDVPYMIVVTVILLLECFLCYAQTFQTNILNCILAFTGFLVLNKSFVRKAVKMVAKRIRKRSNSD